MKQKIVSMLMAVVLLLTTVDVSVFAAEMRTEKAEVASVTEELQVLAEEEMESMEEEISESGEGLKAEEKSVAIEESAMEEEIPDRTEGVKEENLELKETPEVEGRSVVEETITEEAVESDSLTSMETLSGTCGTNLTWTLEDGTLTISGTGAMKNYDHSNPKAPWQKYQDDITKLVINEGITRIGNYAFTWCSNIRGKLEIPEGVISIGDHAFAYCTGATGELEIPESVTRIESGAFSGCSGLTGELKIPSSITNIGVWAFSACGFTGELKIPSSITSLSGYMFCGCKGITSVEIPNNITSIGSSVFTGCSGIKELEIPDSVTNIGFGAFNYCSGLKRVKLPSGLTKLEGTLFDQCEELTELEIPLGITSIGNQVFYGCSSLEKVKLPENVTEIGMYAFADCVNLKGEFVIPLKVTKIKRELFSGCSNLNSVEIPVGATNIEDRAFQNCPKLYKVYIPKSVKTIGEDVFKNCPEVKIHGKMNSYAETYARNNKIPFVPDFDLYEYRADVLNSNRTQWLEANLKETPPSETIYNIHSKGWGNEAVWLWSALDKAANAVGSPASLLEFKEKDVYSAIILDVLEASTDYGIVESYEAVVEDNKKFLSEIKKWSKNMYAIDIADKNDFFNLTSTQQKELLDFTDKSFKDVYDKDLASLGEVFDSFATALDNAGCIEDYVEKISYCLALADLNESMKNVLRDMYANCPSGNPALKLALSDCITVIDSGFTEMVFKVVGNEMAAIGHKVAKNWLDEAWGAVKRKLNAGFPTVDILLAGYQVGDYFANSLFETDATVGQYHKIKAVLAYEELVESTYNRLRSKYLKDQTRMNAEDLLTSLDLLFTFRDQDCVLAHGLADILDKTVVNEVYEAFGGVEESTADKLKRSIRHLQEGYFYQHDEVLTQWIGYLGEDYPDSGLAEQYQFWYDQSEERRIAKEFVAACPVDVYVYDSKNRLVASVVNREPYCLEDVPILAAVSGEEKSFRFYGNEEYRIECIGSDRGEMDITIREYDDRETKTREVRFYDVPLKKELSYEMILDKELQETYELETETGSRLSPDYDSSKKGEKTYQLFVNAGMIRSEEGPVRKAKVAKNATLEIAALVPQGYTFAGWTSDARVDIFADNKAMPTTVCMPERDVVITALLTDESGNRVVSGIMLNQSKVILKTTQSAYLTASVMPEDAEAGVLVWSSDDENIATVSAEGKVTAVSQGKTKVRVTDTSGKMAAVCQVIVSDVPLYDITFDSCGGNSVKPIEDIFSETTISLPREPVREGYFFQGWYTKPEGKGTRFTEDTKVTESMTLYAFWIGDGIYIEVPKRQVYTGNAVTPEVTVMDGEKELIFNQDYTLVYKNNKNAYPYLEEDYAVFEEKLKKTGEKEKSGTFDPQKAPQIMVKMKGNYSGTKTVYFKIEPLDLGKAGVETENLTVTYSGKKQTPVPEVIWEGKALKYGKDFYIPQYDDAEKNPDAFKHPQAEPYKLTVIGKGNFSGTLPITLTISESEKQVAMNKVTVKGIKNLPWTGEQIIQSEFTVTYKDDVSIQTDEEYSIRWGTNTDVGTGTVTFTGTGRDSDGDGYSYIGTKNITFKIQGKDMKNVVIAEVEKSYDYTGSNIEPVASLSYKSGKNAEAVPMIENIHYTVEYEKNKEKGTAVILFKGKESAGYTGVKKQTFQIVSADLETFKGSGDSFAEKIRITFKDTEHMKYGIYKAPYMKGGAKPEVIVTAGGGILKEGVDYTVRYVNNKKVATYTDKKAPAVIVKGKGNFKGSKTVPFSIVAKSLTKENGIQLIAVDKVANGKKNGYRQKFKVYDADGKLLGKADYDVKSVEYKLIRTTKADGTYQTENKILNKKSIVTANSVISITIKGKGVYAGGKVSGVYTILEKNHDISKAVIQIEPQKYTGEPIMITDQKQFKTGKVYLKIGKEKKELILGKDIEVVSESYEKNKEKGNAKVTFRGIGKFGGTKKVTYKIGARSIQEFWKGIYERIEKLFE